MPPVSLKKILDTFEFLSEEHRSYVNSEDGEVLTISNEEWELLESDEWPSDLPDWQLQILERLRLVDLNHLVALPDKSDVDEWNIMRRFALSLEQRQREALLDAIHGSGAFRSFKREVEHLRLREAWFQFRAAAHEAIARDWIAQTGYECIEDAG